MNTATADLEFKTQVIKGSPSYSIVRADGTVAAYAHCVHVPTNRFTLVVDGKWAGIAPESNVVATMHTMIQEGLVS